ncbi:MAG TPA: YggS family pyridoxal phosphate-dependent enzyme [Ignavibacteria bacterium]|nr:YggS family pyridoxal phosphate-dependent enzyme [Ignavibacteria bacterium]
MNLEKNYLEIKSNVREICERAGRDPEDVKIIGVSKRSPIMDILELNKTGLQDFGENRCKELKDKYYNITFNTKRTINWHMIGHVQSGKIKDIIAFVSLIHSVDSLNLAKEINTNAKKINKVKEVLVQVNTSNEPQKYGIDPSEVRNLCSQISELENVRLKGLMTMAKLTEDKDEIRASFRRLKNLFDELKPDFKNFIHLSMGMTNDYEIAIEEGSTLLRIGSAIFGNKSV